MRLLAEFALVLITIAFVQSKPVISQVNNLEAVFAAYPQYSALIHELSNFAAQVTNILSPSQLYSLEQQAHQLAEKVFNGKTDVNTAVNQLLQQIQEYLSLYPELSSKAQSLVQQLVNAVLTVLPNLSSNIGTRSATVARTDILALLNQLQLNSLEAVLATFPQYTDLINQLVNVAIQVSNTLSPSQLYSLEQQAIQVAQNVFNGNTDINTAVNQLLQQLQQYLGADSSILANVQPLVQQLVGAVLALSSQ